VNVKKENNYRYHFDLSNMNITWCRSKT